jgi:NAD(P) transhydrogenase subunit alpha
VPEAASLEALLIALTIFVLATFVGFEVITKVPPTLHTPLMSGSNAISGITLVGALVVAGRGGGTLAVFLGTFAVALATVNVVGGFVVTDRMLRMFRREERGKPGKAEPLSGGARSDRDGPPR